MKKENTRKSSKHIVVLAIVLMMAFVIGISGFTYAKYITTKSTTAQTATVAKWGFVVTANAEGLFGKDYNKSAIVATNPTAATIDVSAEASETARANVVAPGTTGTITFSVKGKAEVDALISFAVDKTGMQDIYLKTKAADAKYSPIVWSFSYGLEGNKTDSTNTTLDAFYDEIKNVTYKVEAGTEVNYEVTMTWTWNFDNTAATDVILDGTTDTKLTGNQADTILGYIANGNQSAETDPVWDSSLGTAANYEAQTTINTGKLTLSVTQVQNA